MYIRKIMQYNVSKHEFERLKLLLQCHSMSIAGVVQVKVPKRLELSGHGASLVNMFSHLVVI